jgi:N-methylhydantoinase A
MIIGLDVGGTHTDAVLLGAEGLVREVKVATDPANLFETVLLALESLMVGVEKDAVKRLVLSTTLATNLVVQKKLPPVAMLVAGGPGIHPDNFRTNDHYFTVSGALDHRGREIQPIDPDQIRTIGEQIHSSGLGLAGVVSKFSVRNPKHEEQMAALLAPYVERVFMGHQFSGILSFPRRIATTYLNTSVYPVHRDFFEAVQKSLNRQGLAVPIRVLKPDGGNMILTASLDFPCQTILSGPSASVMGALGIAPQDKTCLILDIGGTTTDMAVLIDGVPLLDPVGIEISGYKTLIRALKTESIGIGGDSVVRVTNGRLTIGPDRQGPPMAYGGPLPTPTDAFRLLGLTSDGNLEQARSGIEPLAKTLELSLETTATQIIDTACRMILEAAGEMVARINSQPVYTVHEMIEGRTVRPEHILVLGGPANLFVPRLAALFQGTASVVPHWQVANAIGCALARTTCEVSVFADTAQGVVVAPEEQFHQPIEKDFDLAQARALAMDLLRTKALNRGAHPDFLYTEIIEESQFNMIRGFRTIGKNIRVRAQVKPSLIQSYDLGATIEPSREWFKRVYGTA